MTDNNILEKYIEIEKKIQKVNDTILIIKNNIDKKIRTTNNKSEKEKLFNEFKETINNEHFKTKYKNLKLKQKKLKSILDEMILTQYNNENPIIEYNNTVESTNTNNNNNIIEFGNDNLESDNNTFKPNINLVEEKLINMISFYKDFINQPIILDNDKNQEEFKTIIINKPEIKKISQEKKKANNLIKLISAIKKDIN
jgi:hypothetical protein